MKIQLKSPIAILGFGTEGRYAFQLLREMGYTDITICDQNTTIKMANKITCRLGKNAFDELTDFETIIRSPGIPPDLPGLEEARELNITITSLTQLTLETAADRLTAITGTNGKTTTSTLCEKILRAHYGDHLIVGGNDRQPTLKQALKTKKQPILMEVSSFQFADLKHSPYIAAVLNITPNHLDWHATMEEYIQAKANLLHHQKKEDWAILNANNENSAKLKHIVKGQLFWVGKKQGSEWAVWEEGYLRLCFDGNIENVLHYDQLNIKTHPDNLLFAAAIAKLHHVPLTTIEEQIKLFKGVEHRLQHIRTLKDIHFYNDSSSTSPESAMAAIDQFIPQKMILMLGGSSKGADFSYLAQKIVKEKVRTYLYGKEGQNIKEAILSAGGESLILKHDTSADFKTIIKEAYSFAKPEDNIVLSPGCASFDLFKNAKERGVKFTEIVEAL